MVLWVVVVRWDEYWNFIFFGSGEYGVDVFDCVVFDYIFFDCFVERVFFVEEVVLWVGYDEGSVGSIDGISYGGYFLFDFCMVCIEFIYQRVGYLMMVIG